MSQITVCYLDKEDRRVTITAPEGAAGDDGVYWMEKDGSNYHFIPYWRVLEVSHP